MDHRLVRHGKPGHICPPFLDKDNGDWGDLVACDDKATTVPDNNEVVVKPSEPGVTTPDPTPPTEGKEPEVVVPSKPDETPKPTEQTNLLKNQLNLHQILKNQKYLLRLNQMKLHRLRQLVKSYIGVLSLLRIQRKVIY